MFHEEKSTYKLRGVLENPSGTCPYCKRNIEKTAIRYTWKNKIILTANFCESCEVIWIVVSDIPQEHARYFKSLKIKPIVLLNDVVNRKVHWKIVETEGKVECVYRCLNGMCFWSKSRFFGEICPYTNEPIICKKSFIEKNLNVNKAKINGAESKTIITDKRTKTKKENAIDNKKEDETEKNQEDKNLLDNIAFKFLDIENKKYYESYISYLIIQYEIDNLSQRIHNTNELCYSKILKRLREEQRNLNINIGLLTKKDRYIGDFLLQFNLPGSFFVFKRKEMESESAKVAYNKLKQRLSELNDVYVQSKNPQNDPDIKSVFIALKKEIEEYLNVRFQISKDGEEKKSLVFKPKYWHINSGNTWLLFHAYRRILIKRNMATYTGWINSSSIEELRLVVEIYSYAVICKKNFTDYIDYFYLDISGRPSEPKRIQNLAIDWRKNKPVLYVYTGFSYCQILGHSYEEFNARVGKGDGGCTAYLRVFYCFKCRRYFASIYQLRKTLLDVRVVMPIILCKNTNCYSKMKPISELKYWGYDASQNSMSVEERENLLGFLVSSGLMTSSEIISHLSGLISMHRGDPRWQNAVEKYLMDIRFLNEYGVENNNSLF